MTEKEYHICIGKIISGNPLSNEDAARFVDMIAKFEEMLDEGDQDDVFGTEGWRHNLGWD